MIAEQSITLAVEDGTVLEAQLQVPAGAPGGVAVCHPHPLYGGDMDHPVVLEIVPACAAEGLATLRFNFRGVGASTGSHGGGQAEQHDLAAALDHLADRLAGAAMVAAAGYSFGAMVAAAVAASRPDLAGLVLVAPPLAAPGRRLDTLAHFTAPLLVVAGTRDDICPRDKLTTLGMELPRASIHLIPGADHSFWGALDSLHEAVRTWARGLRARD